MVAASSQFTAVRRCDEHLLLLVLSYTPTDCHDTTSCCALLLLQGITKDAAGQVTAVTAELHLAGDFKKTKLKLTWLADVPDLVPLVLTDFDYLITKKKVCGLVQPGACSGRLRLAQLDCEAHSTTCVPQFASAGRQQQHVCYSCRCAALHAETLPLIRAWQGFEHVNCPARHK